MANVASNSNPQLPGLIDSLNPHFNDQLDRADSAIEILRPILEKISSLKPALNYAARLAEQEGESEEDLFMTALALYEIVLEAKARDQRIVIVEKDYKFVREITGIGRPAPEPSAEVAAS